MTRSLPPANPEKHVFGDWGTSRLRLFRIEDGRIADRVDGAGIGAFDRSPQETLAAAIANLRARGAVERITLCGMAGSRNGLAEVAYAECPVDIATWRMAATTIGDDPPVTIAAGLACTRPNGAPDVMRGEETQVFGAIALVPALGTGRHMLALPGTHGKWVRIEDGRILDFRTFLTGELFALLDTHSTLTRASGDKDGGDEGFAAGLARAACGDDLLGALFEARAAQLRLGRSLGWARGFLSGLLIGHEVRIAAAGIADVTVIGDPRMNARYEIALDALGVRSSSLDGDACAIAGLRRLQP